MVPIRIDVFSILIFLGVVQGLFVSVIFFRTQTNRLSNRLLGLLVLTLTAFSIDTFLGYSGYMTRVLHLVDFTETFNFALAPLLYLYVVATLDNQKHLHRSQYLHFIPALLYAFYFLLFFLQTEDYKYNAYIEAYYPELPHLDAPARWPQDPLMIKANINLLQIIHIALYYGFSIQHYIRWKKDHIHASSPWVKGILIGAGVSLTTILIVKLTFERDFGEFILGSKTALLIYALCFVLISKSAIFRGHGVTGTNKYQKSTLPEDRIEITIRRLESLMVDEQPYLDPSFSLPSLAEKLNLSTHHLSQLLNGHLNKSFYEFTASYRVETAKSILAENDLMSIEQVAEQVGYFSKSSFNTAFKKHTGMTPSQYRKTYAVR